MKTQLDLAYFDHRATDEVVDFLDGSDTYILVFGDKPFTQEEANAFAKAEGIELLDEAG